MTDKKAERELGIFRRFAVAAGLSPALDCGENRRPPEPDILFRDEKGACTAFELVEPISEHEADRLSEWARVVPELHDYYDRLSPDAREAFDKKYGNAQISILFREELLLSECRAMFGEILTALVDLPDGFEGNAFHGFSPFKGKIDYIIVTRGKYTSPVFCVPSGRFASKYAEPRLARMFDKQYKTPHPTELIIYSTENKPPARDYWAGTAELFVFHQPRPWPFRRVWLYDDRGGRIVSSISPEELEAVS